MRWFLLALALAVGMAQSQEAPKKQSTSRQKPAADDQRGTEKAPLVIKGSITTKADEKSTDDREAEKHKRDIEEGIKRYTGLAALFTFFLVVITGILARYTYKLWQSTHKLVEGADDTAKRQLRAYVTVDVDSPHYGKNGGLRVRVRNHGDTPSKNTCIWTNVVDEIPDGFAYPDRHAPVLVGYLVAPKQHFAVHVTPAVEKEKGIPKKFFVYGHIDYTDIFEDRWTVIFCHEHKTEGWFFPHHEHNDEKYLGKDRRT